MGLADAMSGFKPFLDALSEEVTWWFARDSFLSVLLRR
jgi:hypothetical protein